MYLHARRPPNGSMGAPRLPKPSLAVRAASTLPRAVPRKLRSGFIWSTAIMAGISMDFGLSLHRAWDLGENPQGCFFRGLPKLHRKAPKRLPLARPQASKKTPTSRESLQAAPTGCPRNVAFVSKPFKTNEFLLIARARPKRCFAGFRASVCFSPWRRSAGKQAEQHEYQNENNTNNTG